MAERDKVLGPSGIEDSYHFNDGLSKPPWKVQTPSRACLSVRSGHVLTGSHRFCRPAVQIDQRPMQITVLRRYDKRRQVGDVLRFTNLRDAGIRFLQFGFVIREKLLVVPDGLLGDVNCFQGLGKGLSPVLLIGDFFHPVHGLAVE